MAIYSMVKDLNSGLHYREQNPASSHSGPANFKSALKPLGHADLTCDDRHNIDLSKKITTSILFLLSLNHFSLVAFAVVPWI